MHGHRLGLRPAGGAALRVGLPAQQPAARLWRDVLGRARPQPVAAHEVKALLLCPAMLRHDMLHALARTLL